MDFIIGCLALAIVLCLIYFLFQEIKRQQKVAGRDKRKKLKKRGLNKKLLISNHFKYAMFTGEQSHLRKSNKGSRSDRKT
jgi:hypothetical protein